MSDALTITESRELTRLETVISHGLGTFQQVGLALVEIRDKRLYRCTNRTFEGYCREKWGFSKSHGNRIIEAARAVQNLTPNGVKNVSQARALAGYSPEVQAEVLGSIEGRQTADKIRLALTETAEADALRDRPASTPRQRPARDRLDGILRHLRGALRLVDGSIDTADRLQYYIDQAIQCAEAATV